MSYIDLGGANVVIPVDISAALVNGSNAVSIIQTALNNAVANWVVDGSGDTLDPSEWYPVCDHGAQTSYIGGVKKLFFYVTFARGQKPRAWVVSPGDGTTQEAVDAAENAAIAAACSGIGYPMEIKASFTIANLQSTPVSVRVKLVGCG
jgi:hypothetical protein